MSRSIHGCQHSALSRQMSQPWSFADEHLHWILEHSPVSRLLPLAAVAQQWRSVAAELMRMRANETREQQWFAAMACGPARDVSSKAKAHPACLALLSRATRHTLSAMRMVPDLAIVFVSEATKAEVGLSQTRWPRCCRHPRWCSLPRPPACWAHCWTSVLEARSRRRAGSRGSAGTSPRQSLPSPLLHLTLLPIPCSCPYPHP